jgi:hypothetical protein
VDRTVVVEKSRLPQSCDALNGHAGVREGFYARLYLMGRVCRRGNEFAIAAMAMESVSLSLTGIDKSLG